MAHLKRIGRHSHTRGESWRHRQPLLTQRARAAARRDDGRVGRRAQRRVHGAQTVIRLEQQQQCARHPAQQAGNLSRVLHGIAGQHLAVCAVARRRKVVSTAVHDLRHMAGQSIHLMAKERQQGLRGQVMSA
jgi:hypothetical protein